VCPVAVRRRTGFKATDRCRCALSAQNRNLDMSHLSLQSLAGSLKYEAKVAKSLGRAASSVVEHLTFNPFAACLIPSTFRNIQQIHTLAMCHVCLSCHVLTPES
jgi:hypothetical protein